MVLKWLLFPKKLQKLPSCWGLRPQAPILVILFTISSRSKCQKRSKYHPNSVKIAVFSEKNWKNCPAAAGLLPRPHYGNLFSRTQSSQPTTFKIVITGFLNKQKLK